MRIYFFLNRVSRFSSSPAHGLTTLGHVDVDCIGDPTATWAEEFNWRAVEVMGNRLGPDQGDGHGPGRNRQGNSPLRSRPEELTQPQASAQCVAFERDARYDGLRIEATA